MTATSRHLLLALLSLSLGVLVAVGASAAVAFPTMKRLDPALPGFEAVDNHWSIAAGSVFQPIFIAATITLAALAAAALGLSFFAVRGMRPVYRKNIVGWLFLVAANTAATVFVSRDMAGDWHAFLNAARAGDAAAALTHRAEFERWHFHVSTMLEALAVLTGVVIVILLYGCRNKAQADHQP